MPQSEPEEQEGWGEPLPQYIPPPSFMPAGLVLGLMLFIWTPAFFYMTPWVIVPVGALVFIVCAVGWTRQIEADWAAQDREQERK